MSDHHRFADQWEVCIHGEEMLGTSLHDMSTPRVGASEATPPRRRGHRLRPLSRRREDSTRRTIGVGGAERARPNRNRQQYQNDHRDNKNRRHEAEGSMKRDRQRYQWYRG